MENYDICKNISERTNGDIYIGVVGPVRSGKSTFIKRFMDLMVLPNISDSHDKERAKDELPQSAAGKTIMTTEPKFIPNEAVELTINNNLKFKMRMIDCVGYLVAGATGHLDGDKPRMVNTPWSDKKIPFAEAAEIGTKKVITNHSTIGIVVTTDGSITDIDRSSYIIPEQRVINELKALNKPFVVLLNTTKPYANETEELKNKMAEKYKVPVIAVNCAQLKTEDITDILEKVLYEFPVLEIHINLPKWIETLNVNHWLKQLLIKSAKEFLKQISKLREIGDSLSIFSENEHIKKSYVETITPGEGTASIEISVNDNLFYNVLSETTGLDIDGDYKLISTIKILADAKKEYDKVKYALEEVKTKGYGVVTPLLEEMQLEKPEIIKHGSKYGVKMKASAPSIHLIRADIETEVAPIVGSEEQSSELANYLKEQYENDKSKIWEYNIFGKSLHDLVNEGLSTKLYQMPEDARIKLQETLQKIINEGNGGLICIIL